MTMATLYPVSKLLKDIVEEKETRMKEVGALTPLIHICINRYRYISYLYQSQHPFTCTAPHPHPALSIQPLLPLT